MPEEQELPAEQEEPQRMGVANSREANAPTGNCGEVIKNLFHEPHSVPCRGDGEDTPAPQASQKSMDNPRGLCWGGTNISRD